MITTTNADEDKQTPADVETQQKELGMITTTNADEDKQTPADVETQSPDDKYTATLCRNLMLYKGTDPTKNRPN
ncbi:hypothetical protein QE152_g11111 [Popillia japonica]|uniref:Uncharacterized protein n=1 Tax=Popillia japonica TaxID=7064 RepID=A0AAW1LSW0_POPJA